MAETNKISDLLDDVYHDFLLEKFHCGYGIEWRDGKACLMDAFALQMYVNEVKLVWILCSFI